MINHILTALAAVSIGIFALGVCCEIADALKTRTTKDQIDYYGGE